MDFFLIKDGVVENVVAVESVEMAQAMYPEYSVVLRTPENSYHADGSPINPGDTL